MAAILVTGYKSFELGIFQDKDERISVIKKAIRHDLIRYFEAVSYTHLRAHET